MGRVVLRDASLNDCIELAPKLRQADYKELKACGWADAEEALKASFSSSQHTYALTLQGELIGIQGIAPGIHEKHGAIWALGTDLIKTVPRDIYELGFQLTDEALELYPAVGNMVWTGNTRHINWIKRIGFTFLSTRHFNNNTFYEFVKVRNV